MSIEKITEYLIKNRESEEFISPEVLDPIDFQNDSPDTWTKNALYWYKKYV